LEFEGEHNCVHHLNCDFIPVKPDQPGIVLTSFNTKNKAIFTTTNLHEWFRDHVNVPILRDLEEFEEKDSGWSLHAIMGLIVNVNKYNPL